MRRTPLTEVSVSDDYISGPLPILREEGGRGTKMGRSTPVLTSFSVCVCVRFPLFPCLVYLGWDVSVCARYTI